MFDLMESDATLLLDDFPRPQTRITESLYLIEHTLEWYDHISCAFLLYEDPREALEKISTLRESYNNKSEWRHTILTPLFHCNKEDGLNSNMSEKLTEVLLVVKHYGLLNILEIAVNSTVHIDQLRLKLFDFIDEMNEEQAKKWVEQMTSERGFPKNDPSWCLEMHCLKWIAEGKISRHEDLSNLLTKPVTECSSLEKLKVDLPLPLATAIDAKFPLQPEVSPAGPSKFEISYGLCIIINQMRFYVDQNLPQPRTRGNLTFRYGSDADRDKLSETFRMLGHDVEIYENLSKNELLTTMENISKYDFRQYDSLVVCFLTHGDKGIIFTADSIPISLDLIKSYFDGDRCPHLLEKPKLFFLQACQGQENQKRICYDDIQHDSVVRPAVSNFFEAWATVPGFLSYRSTHKGAVFVGELCHVLQKYAHKEPYGLLDLMTVVNDRVSRWETPGFRVQMPCIVSCLTRGIRFKRNEKKLVEAVVDQLERELMNLAIMSATRYMWKTDPATLQKTMNTWSS